MTSVVVVIPFYTTALTHNEVASLRQARRVLHRHEIVIIKPADLDISGLPDAADLPQIEVPPLQLSSVSAYSRMMLSQKFYAQFNRYRYLLVYQLDAWVFSDELPQWCSKDYFYIGAPWISEWVFLEPLQAKRIRKCVKSWVADKLPRSSPIWRSYRGQNRVGNGGLSLRRPADCLQILESNPAYLQPYLDDPKTYPEDVFWGLEVLPRHRSLTAPGWREALEFSIDWMPAKSIRHVGHQPFGCHRWPKWSHEEKVAVFGKYYPGRRIL